MHGERVMAVMGNCLHLGNYPRSKYIKDNKNQIFLTIRDRNKKYGKEEN